MDFGSDQANKLIIHGTMGPGSNGTGVGPQQLIDIGGIIANIGI